MKYARLPKSELENLHKEFIDFLVVNGITADDWESLKVEYPTKAEGIVDQFCDVVWEGSLRKVNYLKKHDGSCIYLFKCDSNSIHLIQVRDQCGKWVINTQSKPYNKQRELELFDMIQTGCEICDGTEYEKLS